MPQLTEARWTHVAVPVRDIERSIEFYTSVTPLVLVQQNADESGRSAWLSNPGQVETPFVLVLGEFIPEIGTRFGIVDGTPDPTFSPWAHIGIEVPTREDIDAIADQARELGRLQWEPMQMAEHIGYICGVLDPDGNVLEFSHNQKVFSTIQELWG